MARKTATATAAINAPAAPVADLSAAAAAAAAIVAPPAPSLADTLADLSAAAAAAALAIVKDNAIAKDARDGATSNRQTVATAIARAAVAASEGATLSDGRRAAEAIAEHVKGAIRAAYPAAVGDNGKEKARAEWKGPDSAVNQALRPVVALCKGKVIEGGKGESAFRLFGAEGLASLASGEVKASAAFKALSEAEKASAAAIEEARDAEAEALAAWLRASPNAVEYREDGADVSTLRALLSLSALARAAEEGAEILAQEQEEAEAKAKEEAEANRRRDVVAYLRGLSPEAFETLLAELAA